MSLVNDLLIEAERRRSGRSRPRALALDDLVPTRPRAGDGASGRRMRTLLLGLSALAGLALVGVAVELSSLAPDLVRRAIAAGDAGDADDRSNAMPSVAARRDEVATPLEGAKGEGANRPTHAMAVRPVRVDSISVERLPRTTRIRIVTDARAAHRLEHDPAADRLELVLANAALGEPTAPIDLLDTPIRSLDLRSEAPDLHLRLALDADVHAQTRWLELERGAALVLDLQGPAAADELESTGTSPSAPRAAERIAPVGAAPAADADPAAAPAAIAPSDAPDAPDAFAGEFLQSDSSAPGNASFEPSPSEGADHVYSPSLGDPAALRIEPSERERERAERAARNAKRTGALASARRLRSAGRFAEADAQYAEVVLLAPSDPVPVVEWADVLVELDRVPDATRLLDEARERAPRDQTLLVGKARLLEQTGDRDAAIELLDRSGLALTEAPDVHALAAAYLQRAGRHEAAIDRYEQILRRFPEEPRGWMGLGISLEAVGRKQEARDVYRIALSVGPLPGDARHWVTGRLAALGEKD